MRGACVRRAGDQTTRFFLIFSWIKGEIDGNIYLLGLVYKFLVLYPSIFNLLFFQNFYYVNCKSINIKDFGNKDDVYINLSGKEVITFQDKIDSFGDVNYSKTYQAIVEELYFPKIWKIKN